MRGGDLAAFCPPRQASIVLCLDLFTSQLQSVKRTFQNARSRDPADGQGHTFNKAGRGRADPFHNRTQTQQPNTKNQIGRPHNTQTQHNLKT